MFLSKLLNIKRSRRIVNKGPKQRKVIIAGVDKKTERAVRQFMAKYTFQKPWSEYINGCGISKVKLNDPNALKNKKEDLCITVSLCRQLPFHLKLIFPKEFKGLRVYLKVVGKTRPY